MAWELPSFTIPGFYAEADLRTNQYHAVNGGAAEGVAGLAGAAEEIIGVLQNKPNAGEAAEIMVHGVTKAKAGAAVALHVALEVDGTGRFITLAAGVKVGISLQAAGAADDVFTVLLV